MLKLKSFAQRGGQTVNINTPVLRQVLAAVQAADIVQAFPRAVAPEPARAAAAAGVDLTRIYRFRVSGRQSVDQIRRQLLATGTVEYVTPLYERMVVLEPNDPLADSMQAVGQYHLRKIRAYQGWDTDQGDSTVVVGVVDTGVLFSHEDMQGQLAYNYADPVNGVDDDQDGYVDNFCGWDLADNDHLPAVDDLNMGNPQPKHGALVCGVVGARVNNGKGVAGVGFNCRIMPIKVFASTYEGHFAGFEGIVYAADHGCKVINCSWGGDGFYSPYEQDLITYATVNRDAVVVAAGGNTHADLDFYPASYKGVLAVAAVDANDVLGASNTYSHRISLSAPGKQIYTTHYTNDTTYVPASGSSFASPIVAGTVALVRHHFPWLTAEQAAERVRMTADGSIYQLAGNAAYPEMLGRGRVNVQRALVEPLVRSVRVIGTHTHRPHPGAPADTILLPADFRNLLAPVQGLTVTLTSASAKVDVVGSGSTVALGNLDTLAEARMTSVFRIIMRPDTTPYRIVQLRFGLQDAQGYADYQYLKLTFDSVAYTPAPPRAVIYSFSPLAGEAGTMITINGYNFNGLQGVKFNGVPATNFLLVSNRQVRAEVPAGGLTGPIGVTNSYGTALSFDNFTMLSPVVSSFTPASGGAGAVVTVTGNYFTNATGVTLNGAPITSFTVVSATTLTFTVPPGATTGRISITSPSGTGSIGNLFLVLVPRISTFAPVSATAGTVISVSGQNLADATGVALNGVALTNFTIVSATTIRFTVPGGATSGPISVTSPTGTSVSTGIFTMLTPRILGFSPTAGLVGTTVNVTGNGFVDVSSVTIDGVPAPDFTQVNSTTLQFVVPAGARSGAVIITTGDGVATSTGTFTLQVPRISSFAPAAAAVGTTVTLTGNYFTGATSVTLNGQPVPAFTVSSSTTLSFVVPVGATTGIINVTTPTGSGGSATSFTVMSPKITSFSPLAAVVGATVTLTGSYLNGATGLALNGVDVARFTVVSATSITFVLPAEATSGVISVTNQSGTGASASIFKVLPTLTSFSPASGAPGTVVTITGTGLTAAQSITFNGIPAVTYAVPQSTTLLVTVPPLATTGKVALTTTGGTATSATSFTVAPIITNLFPAVGVPGSVVLVQGLNFVSGTTVSFNGINATTTYNSATQLTAVVPAGAATGLAGATNAYGTGWSATAFVVASGSAPKVTSFAPTANVCVGTTVTITGTGFTGATGVRFNNVDAVTFSVVGATTIAALVPPGATTGKVYVVTPAGMAASAANLTIVLPPSVTSFSPTSGTVNTQVIIRLVVAPYQRVS